jgi:hypothetical protein
MARDNFFYCGSTVQYSQQDLVKGAIPKRKFLEGVFFIDALSGVNFGGFSRSWTRFGLFAHEDWEAASKKAAEGVWWVGIPVRISFISGL